jgi:hypothetical protein
MKEKDIKDILKSKFQLVEDKYFPDQLKTVLSLFFKKIDYFSHPENLFNVYTPIFQNDLKRAIETLEQVSTLTNINL